MTDESMDKRCIYCGAVLPGDACFCPRCAKSLIEKNEIPPPRLWRKKVLRALACVLALTAVGLGALLLRRPKAFDGGALVVYSDKDGAYELLVSTRSADLASRVPEEYITVSQPAGETACLPAQLGVFRNGEPADTEAFFEKVKSCTLEAFPNENGALEISGPVYSPDYAPAARECDVFYTGASGINQLVWTLEMENGDTIRLRQTFAVAPFTPQTVPTTAPTTAPTEAPTTAPTQAPSEDAESPRKSVSDSWDRVFTINSLQEDFETPTAELRQMIADAVAAEVHSEKFASWGKTPEVTTVLHYCSPNFERKRMDCYLISLSANLYYTDTKGVIQRRSHYELFVSGDGEQVYDSVTADAINWDNDFSTEERKAAYLLWILGSVIEGQYSGNFLNMTETVSQWSPDDLAFINSCL